MGMDSQCTSRCQFWSDVFPPSRSAGWGTASTQPVHVDSDSSTCTHFFSMHTTLVCEQPVRNPNPNRTGRHSYKFCVFLVVFLFVCVFACKCDCVRVCVCLCASVQACVCVCVFACKRVCVSVCVCLRKTCTCVESPNTMYTYCTLCIMYLTSSSHCHGLAILANTRLTVNQKPSLWSMLSLWVCVYIIYNNKDDDDHFS